MDLPFVLSISPLVLFLILLLGLRKPLSEVSLWTLGLMIVLALIYWQIAPVLFWASFAKGIFVALDIFLIIFGAIFFLEVLRSLGVIGSISYYLESFSKDYRIQTIILAWFFENFLEGAAGFGTAAVIVAPLLIGLGLTPIKAVIVSLLGNSTSVAFGAAGTPIRIGFSGLEYPAIPQLAAWINCIGFLVPIFMLFTITAGKPDRKKQIKEALPFAVWSGIAFVIPSALVVPFGQEFPSIIGAVIGLALVLLTTKLGILIPKNIRSGGSEEKPQRTLSSFRTFFPYALLIAVLILGKIFFGGTNIGIPFALDHQFNLFNPGSAFFLAGLPIAFAWRSRNKKIIRESLGKSVKGSINSFLIISCISIVVQLMVNSGTNASGIPSAVSLIAKSFETSFLPFWTPFISAFGCFLTGSATVSNIMFGKFLEISSRAIGMDSAKILALALVGASAGNMIALADMLAAEAVVGLKNRERDILKGVIVPCLVYLVLIGTIGIMII